MVRSVLALALLGGCTAVSQGYNAITYPTAEAGEAINLVLGPQHVYVAMGSAGIAVYGRAGGEHLGAVAAPPGGSVDDLALADGLLFALDARTPGSLSVLSLRVPANPSWIDTPVAVPVEPFTGIAAATDLVIVSGGTSSLTVRNYGPKGKVAKAVAQADAGRGQPDVTLSADGQRLIVSTHFEGTRFGITVFEPQPPPKAPTLLGSLELKGAGFTGGGAKPANFPIQTVIRDVFVYVAHGGGLSIVRLDAAGKPSLVRTVPLECPGVDVAIEGDTLAVLGAADPPTVFLFTLSTPEIATPAGTIALPEDSRPVAVALTRTDVLVAARTGGLLVRPRP